MTRSRGLITFTERDRIAGKDDAEDSKRYQAVSRVRRRLNEEVTDEVALLEEHHPELLSELREIVGPDNQWLRGELETKRDELETVFPDVVAKLTRLNSARLGLWIRINTRDDHWALLEHIDDVGDYLHARGYNVRAAYDSDDNNTNVTEPIYEGHLYALPAEVGKPEYPAAEMPPGADRIEKHQWRVDS